MFKVNARSHLPAFRWPKEFPEWPFASSFVKPRTFNSLALLHLDSGARHPFAQFVSLLSRHAASRFATAVRRKVAAVIAVACPAVVSCAGGAPLRRRRVALAAGVDVVNDRSRPVEARPRAVVCGNQSIAIVAREAFHRPMRRVVKARVPQPNRWHAGRSNGRGQGTIAWVVDMALAAAGFAHQPPGGFVNPQRCIWLGHLRQVFARPLAGDRLQRRRGGEACFARARTGQSQQEVADLIGRQAMRQLLPGRRIGPLHIRQQLAAVARHAVSLERRRLIVPPRYIWLGQTRI